ncbi:CDGSH iron-sulfur domain-containing protein [Algoriphagus zhangzhouensis]|uniref:Zn-finger domain of CDGSH type-containing protein n=1 Tax=Algoriphagus zhangzhouensis TaxID=1073327 RepID=A0A1M7ZJ54_9BACT|nr:CDGSH iron-sulfur domain-containing protein [Algoriphagus zhangzhouensis]TDY43620.1 CDGSH-type Zn-finger protein [Algoriphagus zhangzhouensis]SHO64918.1 Zn-finger domain of CDGSH type-containing protein [Algoriphagus zhangzhouensis]
MESQNLRIQTGTKQAKEGIYAEIILNGPIKVYGGTPVVQQFIMPDEKGTSVAYQEGETYEVKNIVSLCRCGLSKNKPFCDASHKTIDPEEIDLTETATFQPELKTAEFIEGPERTLSDDEKFCAYARFCDAGQRIWNQVQLEGEENKKLTLEMAHHCPGGRLIVWDNETQQPIESVEAPSISLIEDLIIRCSGPIVLRGGIPVKSSNGEFYEVRNRQALCRCGQSGNKPFCDGTHASMKFHDGLPNRPKEDGEIS